MSATALLTRSDPAAFDAAELGVASLDAAGLEAGGLDPAGLGVAVGSLDTPIGPMHLACTAQGVVRAGFGSTEDLGDMMAELEGLSGTEAQGDPRWLDEPLRQFSDYFDGHRHYFELAVDWQMSHGFYRHVLETLLLVEYGTRVSYGELAEMAGSPGAARAVGTAMSTNPLPLVVPCHRVVRSDGSVGEFGGRPEAKVWLLEHESANRG